jgi:hypothetical protein
MPLPVQGMLLLGGFRSGWGNYLFGLYLVGNWMVDRTLNVPAEMAGLAAFLGGWAWVVDNLSVYLFPNAALGFLNVFFVAELIFMVWLLGWGWRIQEPTLTWLRNIASCMPAPRSAPITVRADDPQIPRVFRERFAT